MHYTKLGKTDLEVSVIGFGAWAIGGWMWGGTNESESIRAINIAIDMGINLIDTAPAYGKGLSEEIVGKAIKGKRDKLIIATKCGIIWHLDKGEFFFNFESGEKVYRFLGPKSIRYEIEQSLSRLGTDYIDLYQTHWQDKTTPIEDTMETLMDLKKEGKIRAIGASNANIEELEQYNQVGQLDVDQEKYNLIDNEVEQEILPWCKNNRVTMLAYSSLAQGLLTGKITLDREFGGDDLRKDDSRFSIENRQKINSVLADEFKPLAKKYNLSLAQLSIAILISQDDVVALCGIRNEKQAKENAKAGDFLIDESDIIKIRNSIETLDF
jgi:aryl-alcohol dehydrogenase-like predicted oxidoreductase